MSNLNSNEKHEFDHFVEKDYRGTLDQHVALSGEKSAFFAELKVQKLLEWYPQLATESVSILDYGCGDGLLSFYLRQYLPKAKLFGIDPSPKSIEYAQTHYEGIEFSDLLDQTLPYATASMDLVLAAGVFHHIPFDEHQAYVREIYRILKPGGIFAMFELNPYNPLTVYVFKTTPIDFNARMLYPTYAKRLLQFYGKTENKFYFFFPAFLKRVRFFERYLTKLPLGALYVTLATKSRE